MSKRRTSSERFPIGEWARERKKKRGILVEANRCIQELNKKTETTSSEIKELEGRIHSLQRKVTYKMNFISCFFKLNLLILN